MNDTSNAAYGHRPTMISDDDQRERDGIHPTEYDLEGNEAMAQRDELERQAQQLLQDTQNWLQNSNDSDAREIYDLAEDLASRLGNPPEDEHRLNSATRRSKV